MSQKNNLFMSANAPKKHRRATICVLKRLKTNSCLFPVSNHNLTMFVKHTLPLLNLVTVVMIENKVLCPDKQLLVCATNLYFLFYINQPSRVQLHAFCGTILRKYWIIKHTQTHTHGTQFKHVSKAHKRHKNNTWVFPHMDNFSLLLGKKNENTAGFVMLQSSAQDMYYKYWHIWNRLI